MALLVMEMTYHSLGNWNAAPIVKGATLSIQSLLSNEYLK